MEQEEITMCFLLIQKHTSFQQLHLLWSLAVALQHENICQILWITIIKATMVIPLRAFYCFKSQVIIIIFLAASPHLFFFSICVGKWSSNVGHMDRRTHTIVNVYNSREKSRLNITWKFTRSIDFCSSLDSQRAKNMSSLPEILNFFPPINCKL